MLLIIDNNDSFTFNIVQLVKAVSSVKIDVVPYNKVVLEMVDVYSHIIFSPGPGLPSEYKIMYDVLRIYDSSKSILGICLGHQAICEYYGGKLRNLLNVVHGVESVITVNSNSTIFNGVTKMTVGRYHSWIVDEVPQCLNVTARLMPNENEGEYIMAVEHLHNRVFGVQFHPESYITQNGALVMKNFLNS